MIIFPLNLQTITITFGSESTISRFGERFRNGQYSLVSYLFAVLLLTVPPHAQPFVKVGARAPMPCGVGATVYMFIISDAISAKLTKLST